MSVKIWRACPQKMEPNGPVLQPAEIFFIFWKKDPRHPVTALEWWYGLLWNWNASIIPMVWYEVTWYWNERDMVWDFHPMVSWNWYGAHIPHWNGVPSRFANSKNWMTQYFTMPHWFLQEWTHSTGIRRNPQEWAGIHRNGTGMEPEWTGMDRNGQEWHRNGLKCTFWS